VYLDFIVAYIISLVTLSLSCLDTRK